MSFNMNNPNFALYIDIDHSKSSLNSTDKKVKKLIILPRKSNT